MSEEGNVKFFDALIIGCGPTGLTLGICLLQQGKSVLIADKHLSGLDFSRALLINADTLAKLAPYGISQRLQQKAQPVNGLAIFVEDRLVSSAHFHYKDAFQPLCLPQLDTELCLLEQFKANGGELLRGYAFHATSLTEQADKFCVNLANQANPELTQVIHSTWLFGCDGFHSAVRDTLGAAYPGTQQVASGYSLDVLTDNWPFPASANLWLSAQGSGLAIQLQDNKARIVGSTRQVCDAMLTKLSVHKILWDHEFPMHYHVASTYGRGRLWLAGDAVHVHSPIGGRGMNMGMIDAVALAEAVQSGRLADYEQVRRPVAEAWVAQNKRITQLIMSQGVFASLLKRVAFKLVALAGLILGPKLATKVFVKMTSVKIDSV